MKKNIDKKSIIKGAYMATTVFIFGFFAMYSIFLLWLSENSSSDLPGLFYYKAAALGDPICLPLVTGALYCHYSYNNETFFSFQKISIIIAILAFMVGIAIQAEWLINDNTKLNWSIPELHYFNLGGWYHAAFFVIVLSLITLLLTEYIWYSTVPPNYIIDFFIYFSAIFFGLLHHIDDFIDINNQVVSLLLADITFTVICAMIKIIQNFRLKKFDCISYLIILFSGIFAYIVSLTQLSRLYSP